VLTVVALGCLGAVELTAGEIVSSWRIESEPSINARFRAASAMMTGLLIMLVAWIINLDIRSARFRLAKLNEQLAIGLDKEQELNRTKSNFLAQMSHELRTPLNAILGTSEALKENVYGVLNAGQFKAIKNMDHAARHQLDLVNDLLDLSKIEAGRFEPAFELVSPMEICRDGVEMMQPKAEQTKVLLEMVELAQVDFIRSDGRRVRQMVLNLISNAVKFTPEGGRVTLTIDRGEREVMILVRDTGIGIPTDEIPRMFEPFSQLDSSLGRTHGGTGLGLSLSAKLAAELGGRIEAQSEVGSGSCFTIYLPLPVSMDTKQAKPQTDIAPHFRSGLQREPTQRATMSKRICRWVLL